MLNAVLTFIRVSSKDIEVRPLYFMRPEQIVIKFGTKHVICQKLKNFM